MDITYEDFCKLVEVEMQKVEKEYSQTPIRDREKYLQIWVNINIDLIPDNYLTWLKDELIKLGVKPVETRTGNSYTKKISVENDYPFGGEMSGHLYFRDKFIGNDDGIYAGLRLVEILSKTNKKCTELLDNIPVYYSTDENKVPVEDAIKDKIVSRVEEYAEEKGYNYLTIDGVKVLYDDGFALVRKSNTTPNITTRYEAKTKERLEEITNEYNSLLNKLKEEE